MISRPLAVLTLQLLSFAFVFPPLLAADSPSFHPNRVLLVIDGQWGDPSSFLVRPGNEFHQLASLLKNWGVPFDVARLDQERLDRNHFLGYDGRARYGAILWDADSPAFKDQDYALLADALEKWNISLVALSNRIRQPVLESLLGVHYLGYYSISAPILVTAAQAYLVQGLPSQLDVNDDPRLELTARGVSDARIPWQFGPFKKRVLVDQVNAQVLATQGGVPQITQREISPRTYAIWIGSDFSSMLHYQALRTVLRRALALAVGYQLNRDWSSDAILEMDDQGSAQNSWLEHWHYPTLTQEQIETRLIEPLAKNHALLVLNVCPGFVDRAERAIVPSFRQVFTDEFGIRQDYVSTKRGIDDGLKRGVFEVQSHGWTHMQPDLDSPPGPWWDAPLYEEKAEVGWYREFGDTRRGKEIPAAVQRFHLGRSIEWIRREFGVMPLSFVAGGNGVSESLENSTTLVAARAGFGWFGDYTGPDLALEALVGYSGMGGSEFGGTADAPLIVWIPPDGHDRGISQHPEGFPKIFDQLRGRRYISMNEYVAYLHAGIEGGGGPELRLKLHYDAHYCAYFRDHGSRWELEQPGAEGERRVEVDGKPQSVTFRRGRATVEIPKGLGEHTVTMPL